MEKQYGSRVENKIFTNLFNSRTFLVSPWKSLLKLDARFKFSRISKLHPILGGIFYFDFEKGPIDPNHRDRIQSSSSRVSLFYFPLLFRA